MIEKTEWEVVDVPGAEKPNAPDGRKSLQQLMQALLGSWWRWKLAAVVTLAVLALVFFVAVIGTLVLVGTGAALLAFGAGKLRRWWLQRSHRPGADHPLQRTDTDGR